MLLRSLLTSDTFLANKHTTAFASSLLKDLAAAPSQQSQVRSSALQSLIQGAGGSKDAKQTKAATNPDEVVIAPPTGGSVVEVCKVGAVLSRGDKVCVKVSLMKTETMVVFEGTKPAKVAKPLVGVGNVLADGQVIVHLEQPSEKELGERKKRPQAGTARDEPERRMADNWSKEAAQIARRVVMAAQMGGKAAISKQHSKGRLTIREVFFITHASRDFPNLYSSPLNTHNLSCLLPSLPSVLSAVFFRFFPF